MTGEEYNEDLKKELVSWVRSVIGPIAALDTIQYPNLPKTGLEIMREYLERLLVKKKTLLEIPQP